MTNEPFFESVLEHDGAGFTYFKRHSSSLDITLLRTVFGSLALFSLIIAAGFAAAGAWLIIPFAGLEIAALAVAAGVVMRRAGDFERLAVQGTTADAAVREEHQSQVSAIGTVRNIITSMRLICDVDWTELFERILDLLFEAVSAERGAILLLEEDSGLPTIKAARSRAGRSITHVSRAISRKVLNEKVSLLLPRVLEDKEFNPSESILSSGIRSAMCAPLWHSDGGKESVIGVVYLDSRERTHTFSEEDLELVTADRSQQSLAEDAPARIAGAHEEHPDGSLGIAHGFRSSTSPLARKTTSSAMFVTRSPIRSM